MCVLGHGNGWPIIQSVDLRKIIEDLKPLVMWKINGMRSCFAFMTRRDRYFWLGNLSDAIVFMVAESSRLTVHKFEDLVFRSSYASNEIGSSETFEVTDTQMRS